MAKSADREPQSLLLSVHHRTGALYAPAMLAPAWACWWFHGSGAPHWKTSILRFLPACPPACPCLPLAGSTCILASIQVTRAQLNVLHSHIICSECKQDPGALSSPGIGLAKEWLGCFDVWPGCTQLSQSFKIFLMALSQSESSIRTKLRFCLYLKKSWWGMKFSVFIPPTST